jgi:hypothetical protein
MAEIKSFKGTWDPITLNVTLTWELDVTPADGDLEVKVKGGGRTSAALAGTTYTLRGKNSGIGNFELVVKNAANEVKREEIVVAYEQSLEDPPFVNANADWLTYETVLNKPKFRKTNQSRPVGLYAVDMAHLQLWIRSGMPRGSFQALCAAFFPDHTPAEIQRLTNASWWWKLDEQESDFVSMMAGLAPYYQDTGLQPPAEDTPAWLPQSTPEVAASRAVLQLHVPRYAVLPYNFWDNDWESRSLGTNGSDRLHPIPMIQVKREPDDASSWTMWRTASRSCVMKVGRVKAAQVPWPRMDWQEWNFMLAIDQRSNLANKDKSSPTIYRNTAFKTEVQGGNQLKLNALDDHHFGVKTGVAYVGFDAQPEKQIIGQGGEWLCGSMRSDTIQAIRQLATARGAGPRDDIVIQTEVAMLLERTMSPAMAQQRFGTGNQAPGVDGVALRDLTVLDKDKYYIPPLSIPFIDKDMRSLSQEFACIDDAAWRGFWERNWAEALGQAKALFLVQYGMQHANPNVQNYLLEFSVPPVEAFNHYVAGTAGKQVRVVIRDVADALLVREVAWALFGPPAPCPKGMTPDDVTNLAQMRLPVLRYNFRKPEQAKANETGSTDEQFGPPGIQFLWNRFSGFYVGNKFTKNGECPPERLAKALRLTSHWCIAHSAAYVRTVEKALGVEFGGIRWDQTYDEQHHPDRFWKDGMAQQPTRDQWEAFSNADLEWEEAAAKHIHDFVNTPDGRARICAYHNRGWQDAPATFGVRLIDDAGKPMPLRVVYCMDAGNGNCLGVRITDPDGEIPFFGKAYGEYAFWIDDDASRHAADRKKLELARTEGNISVVKPQAAVV